VSRKDTDGKAGGYMDKYRLFYEMKVRNVSAKDLCDHLGISTTAFSRKCNGKSEFTLKEMKGILDYLNIDSPMGIFF